MKTPNMFLFYSVSFHSESQHFWASPGWLPWFQPEVHALAGGADPGRAGQEQPGYSAEVCVC